MLNTTKNRTGKGILRYMLVCLAMFATLIYAADLGELKSNVKDAEKSLGKANKLLLKAQKNYEALCKSSKEKAASLAQLKENKASDKKIANAEAKLNKINADKDEAEKVCKDTEKVVDKCATDLKAAQIALENAVAEAQKAGKVVDTATREILPAKKADAAESQKEPVKTTVAIVVEAPDKKQPKEQSAAADTVKQFDATSATDAKASGRPLSKGANPDYPNQKEPEWKGTEVTMPWNDEKQTEKTMLKGDKELKVSEPAKKSIGVPGKKYEFDIAMVAGDRKIVEKLDVWNEWAEAVPFTPVTAEEIQDFYVKLVKAIKEAGYVFAKVDFPTRPWSNGIFVAKVDCGPIGNITVKNARHFTEKQLRDRLGNKEGKFNYAKTYGDLFDLNSSPDLKLQTKLKPVIQGGRQVINAEITVEDKIPIHGSIELRNDGSKETSDWRLRTTLQHLNVTDHFDSLTIQWLTGGLFSHVGEDLNAISASYYLPIDEFWSFNIYGGWNESDVDDVLPEIGVRGRGFYMGAQLTRILRETAKYRQQLSVTWFYQDWKNNQDVSGSVYDERSYTLSMPGVTIGHTDKVFDSFAGRNFASLSAQLSRESAFGASSSEEFNNQGNAYSDGDFALFRLQLARYQRFFEGEEAPGKWALFMKTDIQLATDDLPSSMREYIGGFDSVRGYEESELGGDRSVTATLELRTPLLENFIPGLKKDKNFLKDNPDYWGIHRVQLLAFTDFGYVANKTEIPGENNNQSFFSIGMGVRLGLTKYSQMSFDYGIPLVDATDDTPDSGRLHISLQAQF